jgi:hypothetical protein
MSCFVRDWGEKIKESYTFFLMVHKHHHARHKLVLYEYIFMYIENLQANFTLLSTRDSTKCLSATEPYSLHIRSVFVSNRLRFRIHIRTLSAPIPIPKKYGNEYDFTIIRPYPLRFHP